MQKNHQPDHQFLQEMGALLAARASQGRTLPPAVTHLAEHVMSARRHRQLTRAELAQKMGVPEAEIYALEQGLLSYAELDLRFLGKLATALGEEIETLLLLLGRPALMQALQTQNAHRTQERQENFAGPSRIKGETTAPKPRGNRLGYKQRANALYNGCLNLIDFWQQGRLFSYRRVNYQFYPIAAIVVCFCLIGVSLSSMPGDWDAQSTVPSRATLAVRPDGLLLSESQREIDNWLAPIPVTAYQSPDGITQSVTLPVVGGALTNVSVVDEISPEDECVVQAVGRPAICRV